MQAEEATESRYPLRILSVAIIVTGLVLIALSWNVYQSYDRIKADRERDFALQALKADMLYLDEVLTMSARMAAATGDPSWRERYMDHLPSLKESAARVLHMTPLGRTIGQSPDLTRSKLLEMEKLCLTLLEVGRLEEASAILSGGEYEEQKKLFISSVNRQTLSRSDQLLSNELRDFIVRLDEVLTMSARMAAATGDLMWEQRYRSFEPQMEEAIRRAKALAPYMQEAAGIMEAANIQLVEMENRAFALVRQGRMDEAARLLQSPQYEEQKGVYAQGIAEFSRLLREQARSSLLGTRNRALSYVLAVAIVLPVLMVAWVLVIRLLHLWRTALVRANLDLSSQTDELGRANSDLAREISERKRAQEALAEQAVRDVLTRLYNRRMFNVRIREELSRADRQGTGLCLLLCDLDRFKAINDGNGHQVGDEVLKSVAKAILEATRGSDLVFRWGGDEIVVVFTDVGREGILMAAERIRDGAQRVGRRIGVNVDMSIGGAVFPEHGRAADQLIRIADRALYIAKKGGDKVHIGDEEYRVDENLIRVVFQPIKNLQRGRVIGFEALSRDAQGRMSIGELFGRFHAIGQLNELKRLCFRAQIKAAQAAGLQRVFVNVDFKMLGQLQILPRPSGLAVILEISEMEALHDVQNYLGLADKWRQAGYQFAIDDFGAGFISLPFIAQAVPDFIKLDRSTLLQAVSSDKFRLFLKDLVRALRNYSTEGIIAEGVETVKELKVIRSTGIHLVQGFLIGRPREIKRARKAG